MRVRVHAEDKLNHRYSGSALVKFNPRIAHIVLSVNPTTARIKLIRGSTKEKFTLILPLGYKTTEKSNLYEE